VSRSGAADSIPIQVTGYALTHGDEAAIERALINLVENAARHASHRVDVVVSDDDDAAVVAVRDDGPGFPNELLHQAAGRFVRGPGAAEGAGLGLAIVDAIAAAHGGDVEVENRPEGGAEVLLRFPVRSG
jgi:two-component system sensor histidine kinase MtrB